MNAIQQLKAETEREASDATEGELAQLVEDHTAFALWMYHAGRATVEAEENFLFSPISISTAFAMLWPGAEGETAAEIAEMLGFAMPADRFHAAGNRLLAELAARNDYTPGEDEGDAPILEIHNDLWGLDDYPYVPAFLDLLARHYGAGMWIVDFVTAWEEAREEINAYIEWRTRGLIPELLPEDSITDLTRLVLTNVVYFKGAWRFPFDPDATRDAPFTALDGSVSDVPMMSGYVDVAHHAAVDGAEIVELDYVGEGLSMALILPDEGTFAAFEESLDAAGLTAMLGALAPMEGQLAMPRFAFDAELDLVPIFEEAGYEVPFDGGRADFSGLSETALAEGLHVTGAFHQARIILDEEGTEAAAATAIVVGAESAPVNVFDVRLDRPFLFVLRDRPTGTILFLGRVVDAAAAQE
ncbi:MAG: serpin family protein [Deltaproteobacteria bacterium]|nr:MAG: serpin family protein [Deltaproteobacteria bacterium]